MKNPVQFGIKEKSGGRDLLRGHDRRYIYRKLWHYLSHHMWLLTAAILLTIGSSVLSITGTTLAGSAIGAIMEPAEKSVWEYLLLMLLCYTASALISYFLAVLMLRLSQKIVHKMRTDVYDNLVRLPVGFFDTHQAGELVSTISYDINTVNESLSSDVLAIISSLSTVIYSFVLMLTVSPRLILVFCFTIPLSVIFTQIVSHAVRPLFRRRSAALGEMNGYVEEALAGQRVIRTYGAEDAVLREFTEKNRAATEAFIRAEAGGTTTGPGVNFINNLSLSLVNIFGAVFFMGGGISLTALSQFVLLSRKFSGPINQIAQIYADIQSALAAAERVFRLTDEIPEPPDVPDAMAPGISRGDVVFSHVRFGYDPGRVILSDLTFRAAPGTVTAIVGPTGAGKTTIINLLMRFYDIQGGEISIDGVDIRHIPRDALRGMFTMVLQETWLFTGTVYENVAYGRPGTTREEVVCVCRAAGIHTFIESLPDGYDTVVTGAGMNISKGQKQLLTIARAMLNSSSILILDEATSNVDSTTEKNISDAMMRLMQGKTCFVIAHRLSTVRGADNILVVRGGDVIEQGTHESLLAACGFYRELYYSQFDAMDGAAVPEEPMTGQEKETDR